MVENDRRRYVREMKTQLPSPEEILEGEQQALIGRLRQLWIQLAIWSRALIVSAAGSLGDIQAITDRLMEIPDISAAAALITAEKNNDIATVNQETENLYANADRIAGYLVGINSYWDLEQWKDFLDDYIEIFLAGLVARLEGNYPGEITIFDDLQNQAIKIADYMAQGIMQKFHP